jgi:probable F420-dependent oxidoreductase
MGELRFGILPTSIGFNQKDWPNFVKHIEELGYSTVFKEDHLDKTAEDPITMLSTAAANTTKLKIGSLVFCVDFRHPVILAQAAATLQIQSQNRFEFGIGAGYLKSEYTQAGIPYNKPATRISRLDEALTIIKSMWINEKTSFKGKHYTINDIDRTGPLQAEEIPKILVGGGGKKSLSVAGKYADIVSIVPMMSSTLPPKSFKDYTLDSVKKKIVWVKDSAARYGRDPESIEFALYAMDVKISENLDSHIESMSKMFGMSSSDYLNLPCTWIGSGAEVREKLKSISEETGITYFQFFIGQPDMMNQLEKFSEQVVKPLS